MSLFSRSKPDPMAPPSEVWILGEYHPLTDYLSLMHFRKQDRIENYMTRHRYPEYGYPTKVWRSELVCVEYDFDPAIGVKILGPKETTT